MLKSPALLELEDEQDQDKHDLVELVRTFDELFELCETKPMNSWELRELNDLYEYLQRLEENFWGDIDYWVLITLVDRYGLEFPALRHQLGMMADIKPIN